MQHCSPRIIDLIIDYMLTKYASPVGIKLALTLQYNMIFDVAFDSM